MPTPNKPCHFCTLVAEMQRAALLAILDERAATTVPFSAQCEGCNLRMGPLRKFANISNFHRDSGRLGVFKVQDSRLLLRADENAKQNPGYSYSSRPQLLCMTNSASQLTMRIPSPSPTKAISDSVQQSYAMHTYQHSYNGHIFSLVPTPASSSGTSSPTFALRRSIHSQHIAQHAWERSLPNVNDLKLDDLSLALAELEMEIRPEPGVNGQRSHHWIPSSTLRNGPPLFTPRPGHHAWPHSDLSTAAHMTRNASWMSSHP
ncbi:hypothetical protein BKA62DRAFT_701335 [Auriculariales sp. MPI-PUGE-AT-0066]|nr:hypothetical protein BKA62DRAFT_701335 [Auriculariales sp. MPI-PUGE-AT-0066]